ncbi:hypothetical protein EHM69_01925 [candidate division KSB1 bacterium]|nr:MAG: hypothetical protein EHM69_01925 [candidate division KSB1 bacterium]
MEFADLPAGTILENYGGGGRNFFEKLMNKMLTKAIQLHQRKVWPKSDHVDAAHSAIKLPNGKWLAIVAPRVSQTDEPLFPKEQARAYRWEGTTHFTPECWQALEAVANRLIGADYDFGQLMDIAIKQTFGWVPDTASIFDLGRKKKVCSVGVMACLYTGWQKIAEKFNTGNDYGADRTDYWKPNARSDGSTMNIERIPPAFFENEPRYTLIWERKGEHA